MIAYVGNDWRTDLTGQLNYLWRELNSSYKNSVLNPIKKVPNNVTGAKSAADIFVRKFEVPAMLMYVQGNVRNGRSSSGTNLQYNRQYKLIYT